MAITTYAELQTAIADNLARSDLTAYLPDFVTMAENWLNYGSENVDPLRCRDMEVVTSPNLTPTAGVCTLPTDYLGYIRVTEITGVRRPLNFITPDMAEIYYPSREAGLAGHFTIIGNSLYTFPLASNLIELVYYQALPPLASNSTNWLLTKAPGIYLRAALVQAYEFIKDSEQTAVQASLASALIKGMNRQGMVAQYARASLTSRGVTP